MAMYASISQPSPAIFGQPCTFVVAVTNSGASPVTLDQLALVVTNQDGSTAAACSAAQYSPPVGASDSVAAGGTIYRTIGASFFGQQIPGAPGGSDLFFVSALCFFGDDTSFQTSPPMQVGLADPVWGVIGGGPSVVPLYVPSMQLVSQQNSMYAPFFL